MSRISKAESLQILQNEFIIGIRINMMKEAKKSMVQKGKLENESDSLTSPPETWVNKGNLVGESGTKKEN